MADIVFSERAARFARLVKGKLGLPTGHGPGEHASRFKHLVRSGETVANVARTCLGDARLEGLVVTINRSSIVIDRHGVALVLPDTTLDMPCDDEVRIYRENYATAKVKVVESPKVAVNKRLLATIAMNVVDQITVETNNESSTTQLSDGCRVFIGNQGPIGTQFSVKLQASFHSGYVTIAAYESILVRTRRVIFKPDGSCSQLDIDLPVDVAREMAKRDFQCNWKRYYDGYFFSPATTRQQRSGSVQVIT